MNFQLSARRAEAKFGLMSSSGSRECLIIVQLLAHKKNLDSCPAVAPEQDKTRVTTGTGRHIGKQATEIRKLHASFKLHLFLSVLTNSNFKSTA